MDKTISASEANRQFSKLLPEVAEGKSFTIMSRGRPMARVLPIDRQEEQRSIEQFLVFVERLPSRHFGNWSRADLYE